MTAWVVEFVAYAVLVSWATWISWRHPAGLVGVTLALCLLVTEAAYFTTSFGSRVVLEVVQAGAIISAARLAFQGGGGLSCATIVALAIIDLAFCFQCGAGVLHGRWAGFVYGTFTNGIYFLQCLCVATPGVRDAIVGRGRRGASGRLVGSGDTSLDALCERIK